jgi:hypothetical protein
MKTSETQGGDTVDVPSDRIWGGDTLYDWYTVIFPEIAFINLPRGLHSWHRSLKTTPHLL